MYTTKRLSVYPNFDTYKHLESQIQIAVNVRNLTDPTI